MFKEKPVQTFTHLQLAAQVSNSEIALKVNALSNVEWLALGWPLGHPLVVPFKDCKSNLSILFRYSTEDAAGDFIAGVTVGLTVIPQALAYAGIAGLDPAVSSRQIQFLLEMLDFNLVLTSFFSFFLQYGLYGSFLGCFVYIFLGSCKDVPMGPTAIASLLTYQAAGGVWQKAVLLSFLTGLIEIAMGVMGLGFLLNFISGPVSSGYTSAVSLIILSSQVKDIFGIKAKGATFVEMWSSIFDNINTIRVNDTIMGISCICILLLMRLLVTKQIGPKDEQFKSNFQKLVNRTLWLIGTARNAILVILTGMISYVMHQSASGELQVIGEIPAGMPNFEIPPFSIADVKNETTGEVIEKGQTFSEIVSEMGSMLIVIPLIALLENVSVCKSFGEFENATFFYSCSFQFDRDFNDLFDFPQPTVNQWMQHRSWLRLEHQMSWIHSFKATPERVRCHEVLWIMRRVFEHQWVDYLPAF